MSSCAARVSVCTFWFKSTYKKSSWGRQDCTFQAHGAAKARIWPPIAPEKQNGLAGDRALRNSCIDPRKPTFARAEIRIWAQKGSISTLEGRFKKCRLLKTHSFGSHQPRRGVDEKSKQRGDPYQLFLDSKIHWWAKSSLEAAKSRHCTSEASEIYG